MCFIVISDKQTYKYTGFQSDFFASLPPASLFCIFPSLAKWQVQKRSTSLNQGLRVSIRLSIKTKITMYLKVNKYNDDGRKGSLGILRIPGGREGGRKGISKRVCSTKTF